MFCIKCGKQLPEDARFCSACGSKVSDADVFGTSQVKEGYKEPKVKKECFIAVGYRLNFSRVLSKCTIYDRLSRGTTCIQKEFI